MRNWLALSDARYAFVNLKVASTRSMVHGRGSPASLRKNIACRSAANIQNVLNTRLGCQRSKIECRVRASSKKLGTIEFCRVSIWDLRLLQIIFRVSYSTIQQWNCELPRILGLEDARLRIEPFPWRRALDTTLGRASC